MNPEITSFEGLNLFGARVNLHVENGTIVEVKRSESGDSDAVALPALIDLHTHLREPGDGTSETIATGTAAAARGGYSDVFAMANTTPTTDTVERVRTARRLSEGMPARVHPISAATIGLEGIELVDVPALAADGVRIFSDDGHCVDDDDLARALLAQMAEHGTVFAQHAQRSSIVKDGVINERVAARAGAPGWPVSGEAVIIARDIKLAAETGGRLHVCHISTAESVELIRDAKARNLPVTAEVTPHHLQLSDDDAVRTGPALKVNPPLRSPEDIRALRAALLDGTIDVIGTDHAPHSAAKKAGDWRTAAFGLTALETALPIVIETMEEEGALDWHRIADLFAHAPARIGGIADRAGRPLTVGEPASFCVVAPGLQVVHGADQTTMSDNTPFEGRILRWQVILTVVDGCITYYDNRRVSFSGTTCSFNAFASSADGASTTQKDEHGC